MCVLNKSGAFRRGGVLVAAIGIALIAGQRASHAEGRQAAATQGTTVTQIVPTRIEPGAAGAVNISYDLPASPTGALFTISIEVSQDGGQTFSVKPQSVTGDIGAGVSAGSGKRIVWDAGKDVERIAFDRLRVRIRSEVPRPVPTTGRLTVRSEPPGAAVTVDGQSRGVTPLDLSDVAIGERRVTLTYSGYREDRHVVLIDAARTAVLDAKLSALPAAPPSSGSGSGATAVGQSNPQLRQSTLLVSYPRVGLKVGVNIASYEGFGNTPAFSVGTTYGNRTGTVFFALGLEMGRGSTFEDYGGGYSASYSMRSTTLLTGIGFRLTHTRTRPYVTALVGFDRLLIGGTVRYPEYGDFDLGEPVDTSGVIQIGGGLSARLTNRLGLDFGIDLRKLSEFTTISGGVSLVVLFATQR